MTRSECTSNSRVAIFHSSRWTSHIAVLILYLALAILLTWPTVTHLDTHLPGDGGDDPAIAWNLWWVKYALLVLKTSPLYSDYLFYPIGINLAFYTLTVLNALTALPLTLNLGVVAASNLHMWFTMIIGAYGTFLLVRQLYPVITSSPEGEGAQQSSNCAWGPAIFAGLCYAFCSSQLFYLALGQFNIASSHWVPYVVLCVYRSRHAPHSIRWPLLTALFLAMQLWAEMTYASFSIVFIVLYVAYEAMISLARTVHQRHQRRFVSGKKVDVWPVIGNVAAAGILLLAGAVPLLAAMLPDLLEEGDFWVQGSGFAEVFSADLLGFLVPTIHHPFLGGLIPHTGIGAFDKGQHIYVGITLLVLATVGVLWGKKQRGNLFWVVAALFFAWLTLGPLVHVNGVSTGISGPFAILQTLPFFKGNRYPSRYSVFLMLSLAVMAAWGIAVITQRLSQRRIAGVGIRNVLSVIAAGVFLAEHLSLPLPQSDMRVPGIYASLPDAPAGSLLDIPFAWRNGFRITGPIDPSFMFGQFYQTNHQQRLLQGNTSRNPAFKFQYFTEAPILNSLLALETGHTLPPERWEADRLLAGDVLRFFDIHHIVVRQAHSRGSNPSVTPEATIPYIETVLPVERIKIMEGMRLYRVNLPPLPRVVEVSPSVPLVRLYLGEGWGPLANQQIGSEQLLWAQRTRARLLLPLEGGPGRLTMRLYVPGEGQRIAIQLGSQWRSEWFALAPGWNERTVSLPKEYMRTGLNEIWLHFERLYPVDRFTALTQPAPSALYRLWHAEYGEIPIVVQSAGEEVGDFAHIYIGGRDVALNERGYNIAVLERTGALRVAVFDTHLDPAAAHQLVHFLAQVPQDTLVVVAVADEASMRLDEAGVNALRTLGATGDLRGRFRWSHAIIGLKGGAPGTALEAMDGLRPVTLALGAAVSSPSIAAGLAWLRCEK